MTSTMRSGWADAAGRRTVMHGKGWSQMPASAGKFRLLASTKNRQNPAYAGARLGADRVAHRHGCVLTHAVPEKPDDVDEQLALLEAACAERPDAVLIVPAH